MRARLALLAALAIALAVPAQDAVAQVFGPSLGVIRVVDRVNGDFGIDGHVIVTFRGEGVEGTILHRPAREGELFSATYATSLGRLRDFNAFGRSGAGAATVARVVRTAPDGTRQVCTDARNERFFSLNSGMGRAISVEVPGATALRTRCGGPTDEDLAAALPALALSDDALRPGSRSYDLRRERDFSGGGLTGTVRSSLVLRFSDLRRQRVPRRQPRPRSTRRELDYAVERVSGGVTVDVAVPADVPDCADVLLCGLTGTQQMLLEGARGQGSIGLTRRSGGGFIELRGGTVRSNYTVGGSTCADEAGPPRLGVELRVRNNRVEPSLIPIERDVLGHTRCPGPLAEQLALRRRIATGTSFPSSLLLRPRLTLRLRATETFGTRFGRGRTRGDIVVVLRRRGG